MIVRVVEVGIESITNDECLVTSLALMVSYKHGQRGRTALSTPFAEKFCTKNTLDICNAE